ncbi:hypothetical protein BDZ91DRAFT_835446 [Kalaharituber pfeilii]|nr:hypothetical protein BDZ91DRAFT_835446 [Kalaharituber pfeilii]
MSLTARHSDTPLPTHPILTLKLIIRFHIPTIVMDTPFVVCAVGFVPTPTTTIPEFSTINELLIDSGIPNFAPSLPQLDSVKWKLRVTSLGALCTHRWVSHLKRAEPARNWIPFSGWQEMAGGDSEAWSAFLTDMCWKLATKPGQMGVLEVKELAGIEIRRVGAAGTQGTQTGADVTHTGVNPSPQQPLEATTISTPMLQVPDDMNPLQRVVTIPKQAPVAGQDELQPAMPEEQGRLLRNLFLYASYLALTSQISQGTGTNA